MTPPPFDGSHTPPAGGVLPTDAERERFAELLRQAVGTGLLSLEEFETRLDAVYRSNSLRDLEELVRWVPLPAPQPVPSRPKRLRPVATAAGLALIALVAVIALRHRSASGPSVPIITGVGIAYPFNNGSAFPDIHVRWPPHTRGGLIDTSVSGYVTVGTAKSAVDYRGFLAFPVSYRAVACATSCDAHANTGDLIFGPWYRPKVGAQLNAPPPTVTAVQSLSPRTYHLTIRLGQHLSAPAVAIYRDGAFLAVVDTHEANTPPAPVVTYEDSSAPTESQPSPALSYAVAACYSDCFPTALASGFAQATALGPASTVARATVVAPSVVTLKLAEAQRDIESAGLTPLLRPGDPDASGDIVTGQEPPSGAAVTAGSPVILRTRSG